MEVFRGCFFYEPADLGFNAQAVGAGATVDGNIFPVCSREFVLAATIFFLDTGPSTDLDLLFSPVDEDGSTILGNVDVPIIQTVNPSAAYVVSIHISGSTVISGIGVLRNQGSAILSVPYARLVVVNGDGVNAATVTIRASFSF